MIFPIPNLNGHILRIPPLGKGLSHKVAHFMPPPKLDPNVTR